MSNRPGQSFAYRRWMLILYWVVMFVATHWPEIEEYAPQWGIPYSDELAHAGLYAGWTVMWWWVLSAGGQQVGRAAINWLVIGGFVYAGFDEITQAVVDRTPAVSDFVVDVVAVIGVLAVLEAWQRRRTRRQPR